MDIRSTMCLDCPYRPLLAKFDLKDLKWPSHHCCHTNSDKICKGSTLTENSYVDPEEL